MSLDVTLYDNKIANAIEQIKIAQHQLIIMTGGALGCNACDKAIELLESVEPQELYSSNITHNLNKMAMEAGIPL